MLIIFLIIIAWLIGINRIQKAHIKFLNERCDYWWREATGLQQPGECEIIEFPKEES